MRPLMGDYIEIVRPWQKIYVDFLGPYPRSRTGNTIILIILDHYTKFVIIKPLKHATSSALVDCLKQDVFSLFGVPEILFSDNGRQFESNVLSEFLKKFGVTHVFTPKYSPQANASERVNRTILTAIRSYVRENHQNWDLYLDEVSIALKNVIHESTNYSPYYLVFGQHMVLHSSTYQLIKDINTISPNQLCVRYPDDFFENLHTQILTNLKKAHTHHEAQYNLTAQFKEFNVGQTVYIWNFAKSKALDRFSDKLCPKFIQGTVVKRIEKVAYEVINSDGKTLGIFHAKDIKT